MKIETDFEKIAIEISRDLGEMKSSLVPRAQKTAMARATKSAISKWASAAAKAAKVPVKLIRKRAKNEKQKKGYKLRIGTLPISGASLKPRSGKTGVRFTGGRHRPNAFLHDGYPPFERVGRSRLPVRVPTFPVETPVVSNKKVATDRLNEQLPKEMTRKLEQDIRKKLGGKK